MAVETVSTATNPSHTVKQMAKYRQAFDDATCEKWAEREAQRERTAASRKKFDQWERHQGSVKHRGAEKRNRPQRGQVRV